MSDRFRYEGVNWEGRPWEASEPVKTLGHAVSEAWPMGWATDGTVASKAHDKQNPKSDHRPHPFTGPGIVRAIDIGVPSRAVGDMLAGVILQMPPVNYVLWQTAGHTTHIHVSMLASADQNKGALYVFNQHEVEQLKLFISTLDDVDSNGGFVAQCVEDIREKNAAGGRYAPATHNHGNQGGIQPGQPVTIQPL